MADQNLESIVQRMLDAGESEENIATVIQHVKSQKPSDGGALGTLGLKAAIPVAESGVMNLATSPNVPKATASVGRVLGGLSPIIGGAAKGGIGGAALGVAGAAPGAWAGGKTGWFTGKLMQRMAAPVASAVSSAAPYADAILGPLGMAQGVGDLAQMAEPNRQDIGIGGFALNQPSDPNHPALLNLIMQKLMGK